MKIIKPAVEFFGEVPTDYENTLRFIETAGRTCYKSEDKITADSAEGFVKRLIKAGHLAMVEHSNFVIRAENAGDWKFMYHLDKIGKFLNLTSDGSFVYVGGNLTAWHERWEHYRYKAEEILVPFHESYADLFGFENNFLGSFWEVCPHNEIPAALHRYSAKFICDRGVSHELVRHRPCSFAQESTRYVNYGGKDMEFIEPAEWEKNWNPPTREWFTLSCLGGERSYKILLEEGLSPQQARAVLPNSLKTEIIVTADAAEWAHIKKLRTHPSAHPDMVRVMNMMPWEEMGL